MSSRNKHAFIWGNISMTGPFHIKITSQNCDNLISTKESKELIASPNYGDHPEINNM